MAGTASSKARHPTVGILGCRPRPNRASGPRWRSRLRAAVCLAMALLVQSFDDCCGEILTYRQRYYVQSKPTFSIETQADAMGYLDKYGYLNCTVSKSRRQRDSSGRKRDIESLISEGRVCTYSDVRKALRVLQANVNLRQTGQLDDLTKNTMSQRRCGNSDVIKTQPTLLADLLRSHDNVVVTRGAGQRRRRWLSEMQRSYEEGSRSVKSVHRTADHVVPLSEDGTTTGPYGLEPVEYVATDALGIRKQMLGEIRERLEVTEAETEERRRKSELAKRKSGSKVRQRIRRKRRSTSVEEESIDDNSTMVDGGSRSRLNNDGRTPIRWRLLRDMISAKVPLNEQRAALQLAFRIWAEVIPLRFREDDDEDEDITNINILIAFATGAHMSCDKPFDGPGGQLAHSVASGEIHFDDSENYGKNQPDRTDLLKVAIHEVGHVLGLGHNSSRRSIMFPIYVSQPISEEFELSASDRQAVQQIYGVCKGAFDVVFDFLRPLQNGYIYNTYFFRNKNHWMYKNSVNRTRIGDPKLITEHWSGLPFDVDGFVQTAIYKGSSYDIQTFFFKEEMCYKYDNIGDQVKDGYPRKIASVFGSFNESLPNVIDAAWFDQTISDKPTIYFFKGDWVWLYDAREIGRNACCDSKRRFTELFPMIGPSSSIPTDNLTGDVDAVYTSYADRQTYFFKGDLVFILVTNQTERNSSRFGLRKLTHWYCKWHDICEVE